MITHQMKLAAETFEKISNGTKIIESRLYDEKRRKINVGDKIEFTCADDTSKKILADVKALYRYISFKEMFSDFSPEYFGERSKDLLLEKIRNFYSPDEESMYGVIGIKISLVI